MYPKMLKMRETFSEVLVKLNISDCPKSKLKIVDLLEPRE